MVVAGGSAALHAQVLGDRQSTELHMTSDMSSNSSIVAAIASPVKGQPYETRKVTRSVWKLADGTVISHEADTKMARDGEGRVREEIENTSASSVGGTQSNTTMESVTIADPVEHAMMIMTGGSAKVAMRMALPDLSGAHRKAPFGGMLSAPPPPPPPGPPGSVPKPRPVVQLGSPGPSIGMAKAGGEPKDEVRTEDLGKQSLAGLLVSGKRTTTVIPIGKIGNDRPITLVHEEWYSPDLKLVVKSLDSDPRSGERTMELQGMTLGEPDAALFRVPEGYKVQDMGDMMKTMGDLGHKAAEKP